MEPEVKTIKRIAGETVYEGTVTKANGNYIYSYPKQTDLMSRLTTGDNVKISKLTGLTEQYVCDVLIGRRWNALVIEKAKQIGDYNESMGFINN